ncbi:MAG TPA: bifunctional alpha,alpha-trehalose-phosphate synthase (UDP-forming)/trehalose-phosphatase [Vicinamibacteria bacterium]|nr:bifunctional alpha,alpha-trehalose-phosphate synthase (UDP-forming)/trehalose-phosphatase [Vicinamibacteria bacterium]
MAEGKLIVVSNRLPLSLRQGPEGWRAEPSAGGLASALGPILKARGGVWIGWPGHGPREVDPGRESLLREWEESHGYAAVALPPGLARKFYEGYANQTLWPLFHNFATNFESDGEGWTSYVAANRHFRDAVLEHLQPGDTIWIQDYHLMLLPRLIRDVAPEARIGFFLHVPFPASETFRIAPRRDDILRGLLGADLVGFQTHLDLQHFRSSLLRVIGLPSAIDRVTAQGSSTRLEALPIGISPDEFAGLIENDPATQRAFEQLRRRFRGRRILLAVDRLDYTKGIPQRLRAYRKLLERAPHLHGRVVLVQVAVPSRERIPEYDRLRHTVNSLVGEINGEFGTPDWTPVVYMRRGIARSELVGLYAAADVGWVTPLRDGMNLVAKEYVACQRRSEGVLVLSEFAGAAAEMGEAFLVNPYDEDRVAATLERVLQLPAEDRRERMSMLYRRVLRNTVFRWGERYLSLLDQASKARTAARPERPQALPVAAALEAFRASRSRVVLLDYDGTLVPFAPRPADAIPPARVVDLVGRLAAAPGVTAAVVSGRARRDLETWFGHLPELWLVGEHGAYVRPPAMREWEMARPSAGDDWKRRVLPVLEHFVDRTPGSLIEEKELAVVWHHRLSDPEFGEWLANELVATLDDMLADTELHAIRGNKTVEVRFAWANKGTVVERLQALRPDADFRLAMGDDRTDEDLFDRLRDQAWTVRVGEGPSSARYSVDSPADVVSFLEALVSVADAESDAGRPSRAAAG